MAHGAYRTVKEGPVCAAGQSVGKRKPAELSACCHPPSPVMDLISISEVSTEAQLGMADATSPRVLGLQCPWVRSEFNAHSRTVLTLHRAPAGDEGLDHQR